MYTTGGTVTLTKKKSHMASRHWKSEIPKIEEPYVRLSDRTVEKYSYLEIYITTPNVPVLSRTPASSLQFYQVGIEYGIVKKNIGVS